jgi:hypothetical protein
VRAKSNKRNAIAIGRGAGELSRVNTYHGSGELSRGTKAFIAVKGARENRADFVSEQLYQYQAAEQVTVLKFIANGDVNGLVDNRPETHGIQPRSSFRQESAGMFRLRNQDPQARVVSHAKVRSSHTSMTIMKANT